MSKKITKQVHGELMAARKAKSERKRQAKQSETGREQSPEQDHQEAAVATKRGRDGMPARRTQPTTEPPTPGDTTTGDGEELVVFAFRLSRAERDLIHAAAGSAKASKFVRTLAVAAAKGDAPTVMGILDQVYAAMK